MPSTLFIREQPTASRRRSCRKDRLAPILSDEGLPVEIGRSLTRSAFEGDDRASVISQRWFMAEIFSHPEDIVRPVDQRLLAH